MQLKKALGPKSDFMNKLNKIAVESKLYTYKHADKVERQPQIKNLHFKKKEKVISEKDLLDNKIKYNVIAFNAIIPDLLDYINDIFKRRKAEAYYLLKDKAKGEKFVNLLKKHINKNYLPDKGKLLDELKTNKRIQETEGPLQSQLFKLLRKNVLKTMFNKDDLEELGKLLKMEKLLRVTVINNEVAEERWLRILIRKWRFLAFSKVMSKKKLAYLYKHFHVNYLEMANNVFGEQDSNPSIIKEFERFGSNVGIWENEKPDFAEHIKHAKTMGGRRITFTAPRPTFNTLGKDKKEDKKEDEKEKEEKKTIVQFKKTDDEEDEKEERPKKVAKKLKKEETEEEEESEDNENEENEEENDK